jgi:SAM-dependent methyltransferase
MQSHLLASLTQLRPLAGGNATQGAVRCKVCGSASFMFDIVDFNKICSNDYYNFGFSGIPIPYYQCRGCNLVFTTFFDDWTKEDFTTYIYNADYPLIDGEYASVRPARMAEEMAGFLAGHRADRILDYGSGTGVFAERLRARGFAMVENYDPFANPQLPVGQFDIVTCFETIEHSSFPKATIAELKSFMKPSGCILLTTGIQPANINELRANWWYIAPRNGHVAIYTLAALELLAAQVGLELYAGDGMLAFAGPMPSPQLAPLLCAIGPTRVVARLTAPPEEAGAASPQEAHVTARDADWHQIEQSGPIRFRWTRSNRVEWSLRRQPSRYPCRLTLTIPLVMEIVPGFADRCLLEIDARTYPVRREEATITATVDLDRPLERPIALITPEPQRPADLRGTPDQRGLGLAIQLAATLG